MRQLKITKSITNRQSDSLEKYLHDIAKEELISVEQEVELAKRIRNGDDKAFERLVRANLRFVVSVAKQYQNQGLSLSDLINEGNLGLLKAARKFDETRGFKFISYAVWWIRQCILQGIAENARVVRLPLNQIGRINKINRASGALNQLNEREPTNDEIAEALELHPDEIENANRNSSKHVSGDAHIGEENDETLFDIILRNDADESLLRNEDLQKDIVRALKELPDKESTILRLHFGIGCEAKSLEEIGDHLDLSRERVRQLKEKGIRHLQNKRRRNLLQKYL